MTKKKTCLWKINSLFLIFSHEFPLDLGLYKYLLSFLYSLQRSLSINIALSAHSGLQRYKYRDFRQVFHLLRWMQAVFFAFSLSDQLRRSTPSTDLFLRLQSTALFSELKFSFSSLASSSLPSSPPFFQASNKRLIVEAKRDLQLIAIAQSRVRMRQTKTEDIELLKEYCEWIFCACGRQNSEIYFRAVKKWPPCQRGSEHACGPK